MAAVAAEWGTSSRENVTALSTGPEGHRPPLPADSRFFS